MELEVSQPAPPKRRVDRDLPIPLYHQVHEMIASQIRDGELLPGDRLPKEKSLAASLGISLAPVRQAILALVREGALERASGRGTFVRERHVEEHLSILSSFSDLLRLTDRPWHMDMVGCSVVPLEAAIAEALGVNDEQGVHLRRLAVLEDEPVALLDAYLSASRFGSLARGDFTGSLYGRLAKDYGLKMSSARNSIGMARLNESESELLALPLGSGALEILSVTNDQYGVSTEYSRALYHPDRFRFQIDSERNDETVVRLLQPLDS